MLNENRGPFLGFFMTLSGALNISKTAGPGLTECELLDVSLLGIITKLRYLLKDQHLEHSYGLSSDIVYD